MFTIILFKVTYGKQLKHGGWEYAKKRIAVYKDSINISFDHSVRLYATRHPEVNSYQILDENNQLICSGNDI